MKRLWWKEMAWLTLPALLIGALSTWFVFKKADDFKATFRVAKTFVWHRAPYDAAIDIDKNDTDIEVLVERRMTVSAKDKNFIPGFTGPHRDTPKGPNEDILRVGLSSGNGPGDLGPLDATGVMNPVQFHLGLDVRHAPPTGMGVRVTGDFKIQKATTGQISSLPFSLNARPKWLLSDAPSLRLKSILRRTDPRTRAITVEVKVVYSGGRAFVVRGQTPQGWFPRRATTIPTIYNGTNKLDEILVHWSQRVESGDGQYDSLKAMEAASLKTWQQGSQQHAAAMRDFEPKVEPVKLAIYGNVIVITYAVSSLPVGINTPVFKADIGVLDEGFLKVSCPLS